MTPEERAGINAKIERLWNTSPAVIDENPTKAAWTKFARERTRLFNKLGPGCRYCGNPDYEFFMLQGDLWPRVVGVEPGRSCYGAGYVCLACCAQRLFPRQLYDTDFGRDGRDEDEEGNPLNRLYDEVDWVDPETERVYGAMYTIAFPNEAAEPAVKIETLTQGWGQGDWSDAIWGQLYNAQLERIDWLWDYCAAHGLKLLIDGEEVDLTEPEPELEVELARAVAAD